MDLNSGGGRHLRLWAASLLIAAAGIGSLYRSLLEPSLGWRFMLSPSGQVVAESTRGDQERLEGVREIASAKDAVPLGPDLVIESPGIHNSYATQDEFFREQRRLWQLLHSGPVRIEHAGGETAAVPESRRLSELGPRFWFPWAVALLSLSVGLGVWVYRPQASASRCYLLASAGYAFGMLCTASWGSRLLSQPPRGWSELHVASHLASFLVTAGLCALIWLHPRRLGGNWLLWALGTFVALAVAADAGQWLPTISLAFRLPIVLLTVGLGVLYALQWRACRQDPTQRAQLKWFGLLLLLGLSGAFVAYAFGAAGRVVKVPQNYGLASVALLFVGLVPLVTRVGLFQLEAWWPRAWMWFLGGLLVIGLDVALMALLGWRADEALMVALALAGWLYFPIRQAVWQRVARSSLPATHEVLPRVVSLVTSGHSEPVRAQQWRELWDTVFEPLRIAAAAPGSAQGMHDDGRMLNVAAGRLDPLELELPERGTRLFAPADARRASEICALVQQGLASAEAFEHGAREERKRIAADLHDDLGAQLLTIAQGSAQGTDRDRVAALARQALEDMRLAVRGMVGEAAPLADVQADWRAETVTRLAAAGFEVDWQADEADGRLVPARVVVQLTRVLRETISNAVRHSGGGRCAINVRGEGEMLALSIEDDGQGLPHSPPARGQGLGNIERRVRSLGGTVAYGPGALAAGMRLEVRVPLAPAAITAA